jgi:hypothetical protein
MCANIRRDASHIGDVNNRRDTNIPTMLETQGTETTAGSNRTPQSRINAKHREASHDRDANNNGGNKGMSTTAAGYQFFSFTFQSQCIVL